MATTVRPTDDSETARDRDGAREPGAATEPPAAARDRRVQASPPPVFRTTSSSRFRRNLERLHDAS
jgi:hypothetical protein